VLDPQRHPRQIPLMSSAPPPAIADLTFEDALRALEDVVRRLESGEVPLDQSIELYERGEALRAHCQARLDAAQARIEKIVAGPDGRASHSVPFDSDG
jgi:exodeoxyribonuclease VII small subunit